MQRRHHPHMTSSKQTNFRYENVLGLVPNAPVTGADCKIITYVMWMDLILTNMHEHIV